MPRANGINIIGWSTMKPIKLPIQPINAVTKDDTNAITSAIEKFDVVVLINVEK